MLNPFLFADQQAIVVFHVMKSLVYWKRMLIGFGGILNFKLPDKYIA